MNNHEKRQRLAILVYLSLCKHYKSPLEIIRDELSDQGYPLSLDAMRAEADWLEETGLAAFDRERQVLMARERGLEVALGNLSVSGVATRGPVA